MSIDVPAQPRPFRFGLAVMGTATAEEWATMAARAEAEGYSTLLAPDIGGPPTLSPMPALAFAAARTTTLRLGTWVVPADFHNPVLLARDAAVLDLLSGGRFELGLGAGRHDNDYAALGMELESGGVRVSRLGEAVRIIEELFRGEPVTFTGRHWSIEGATLYPPPLRRPPILLAAGGRRSVELAGRTADAVAIGIRSAEALDEQLGWLRGAAGERFSEIELGTRAFVLPEHDRSLTEFQEARMVRMGMDPRAMVAAGSPNILAGSAEAMVEQIEERRARYGLSYYAVGPEEADAFGPVLARLAGR